MICLWSGKDTSKDTSREHIIPENIGGKRRLPKGYVSDEYNNKFSMSLDRALRYHPAFATSYQVHDHITGKKRTGKNSQRKGLHPKEHIEKGDFKSTCKRNAENKKEINSLNPDYLQTDKSFIQGLYKCAANILASRYGVEHVRNEYMPLLEFVLTGRTHLAWSYATCFANPFFPGFEEEFDIFEFRTNRKTHLICLILHASGIWAMAPEPNGLDYKKIERLSNHVFGILKRSKIRKYLGIKVNTNRLCIGSACFY